MLARPPDWTDENAVARFAVEALALREPLPRRYQKMKERFRFRSLAHAKEAFKRSAAGIEIKVEDWIEGAVTEAERGDFSYLAYMLHPDHPLNFLPGRPGPVRAALPPEAWELITARLTGRHKAKRGRPPVDELRRRLRSPVSGAADDFPRIKQFLRGTYPGEKARHVRARALTVAARHHGIAVGTLENFLRRSRNDRRRRSKTA